MSACDGVISELSFVETVDHGKAFTVGPNVVHTVKNYYYYDGFRTCSELM